MSIATMTRVWEKSEQKGSKRLLLLALADFSNDQNVSWPSIASLAQRIMMSERQTQNLIRSLEGTVELFVRVAPGRTHSNRYLVMTGLDAEPIKAALIKEFEIDPVAAEAIANRCTKGEKIAPFSERSESRPETEKVKPSVVKGEIAIAPDPLDPSIKESESFTNVQDSARNPLGEEFDGQPIPKKQAEQIERAKSAEAIKRLQNTTLTPLVKEFEAKEKVPRKRKNVPPQPTCFMGGGRYVGPFPSMAAAQRYSAGHGTITDRSAVPAGIQVEAPPKVIQPAGLLETWIVAVGKDRLPAGFSYGPYLRFMKALLREKTTDLTCAGDLYRAWIEASPNQVIDWSVGAVTNAMRRALALCAMGYVGAHITAFLSKCYAEPFWKGKVVSFDHVSTRIAAGENNGSNLLAARPGAQPAARPNGGYY